MSVGGECGVDNGEARSPFQVSDQGGAELGVFGELQLVGGLEEEGHPAAPLVLREVPVEVLLDHVRMAAVLLGIGRRAAEDFREEGGDVSGMVGAHVGEERRKQRVVLHVLVEARGQAVQGVEVVAA